MAASPKGPRRERPPHAAFSGSPPPRACCERVWRASLPVCNQPLKFRHPWMLPACCVVGRPSRPPTGCGKHRTPAGPQAGPKQTPLPCSFIPYCHLASHTGRRTRASHRCHPALHATLSLVSALRVSKSEHRRNRPLRQHVPALSHGGLPSPDGLCFPRPPASGAAEELSLALSPP